MSRTRSRIAVAVIAVLLAGSVWQALNQRFDRGDVYPPYSTLRGDPLGSKVVFESLAKLDGLDVKRSLEPLEAVSGDSDTTLFILGLRASPWYWHDGIDDVIASIARQGLRTVVTFSADSDLIAVGTPTDDRAEDCEESNREDSGGRFLDLELRWSELEVDENDIHLPAGVRLAESRADTLPKELNWRSPIVVLDPKQRWQAVYLRENVPVVLMREFGRGSVVLVSDSFFVSNESLILDRQTELISWLVGSSTKVVFDESHLGVQRPVGIMVLARRYRLMGFFVGLAALAIIYVWRTVLPFAPIPRESAPTSSPGARGSQAALVHILRRGLNDAKLFDACVKAWMRSFAGTADPATVEKIKAVAASEPKLMFGYHQVTRLLASKKVGSRERGASIDE